jgi:hypothetical protein
MALLWCDGFEGYGASDGVDLSPTGVLADKYMYVDQENRFTNRTSGRNGAALECSDTLYPTFFKTYNIATTNTVICGVAYYFQPKPDWNRSTLWPIFRFENGGGNYCASVATADTGFYLRDAAGAFVGATRVNLEESKYNYVELKIYSHATAGTMELRVNGCPVASVSSINTQASTGGAIANIQIGFSADILHKRGSRLDDFYVCDDSGSTNNDFLGDITVRTLFPNGDDTTQFATTGNGSYSTHYEQVNYADALPATDYIEDGSTGNRDIFTLADSTDNFATVYGVMGFAYTRYDTTANNYRIVFDSNGTESESANIAAASTYRYDSYLLELDPDTASAWTDSTINALKIGVEVQ